MRLAGLALVAIVALGAGGITRAAADFRFITTTPHAANVVDLGGIRQGPDGTRTVTIYTVVSGPGVPGPHGVARYSREDFTFDCRRPRVRSGGLVLFDETFKPVNQQRVVRDWHPILPGDNRPEEYRLYCSPNPTGEAAGQRLPVRTWQEALRMVEARAR